MPTTTRSVPLFDLARNWPAVRDEIMETFERISSRGAFSLGEELAAFEAEFAEYLGAGFCVGVANGTVSIELALRALGVGPGDEVVTVPHTFIATVEAIAATGATPVFVDIDPGTRCMDPSALAGAVTERTRAVVPVHLYGRPAPMAQILEACGDIPVVEDTAQAHGATLDGRRTGSFGAAGSFSFYPTKNLGAFGDGGAVFCKDEETAALIRSYRHHGAAAGDANRHERAGGTERLDALQAAILRIKLRTLDAENDLRREAADRYRDLLADVPVVLPPGDPEGGRSVYHLFCVEVENRDAVLAALREQGVGAASHYPTPAHLQPAWSHLASGAGSHPASEHAAAHALSLPLFPGITEDEQAHVAEVLTGTLAA
jgi:dTDP-4-amino-4,6-dideoxygalactose transaminase